MARRTPEEILAQREAWLARKTAREAGQDIPIIPPLKPGEESPEPETSEPEVARSSAEPSVTQSPPPGPESQPEPAQLSPEPAVAQASAKPEAAQSVVGEDPAISMKPVSPKKKRTPEEIRAQREAFMAAKAAKAAGTVVEAPAPPVAPAAQPTPAPTPKPTPRPARAKKAAPPPPEPAGPVTRREFLNYAWLASLALVSVQAVGLSLWFAFPNFLEGEFGGVFPIGEASEVLPEVNAAPIPYTDGKFWLSNVDIEIEGEPRQGVLALFKVCTHLGCLYDWVDVTFRFECPCHGSKFELTGDYIAGPARRSLDRFVIVAQSPDGTTKTTNEQGDPLVVDDDDMLFIDTGQRILGSSDIVPA